MTERRAQPGICADGGVGRRRARGMTLIELMVAVAVMAVMIVAVGTILTQTERLVTTSTGAMRANQVASSIAETIRSDFRKVRRNVGFLCIATTDDDIPLLILTTVGTTPSLTGAAKGTGAFICYGLVDNPSDSEVKILWRPGWVLGANAPASDVWSNGGNPVDLADLQAYSRANVKSQFVDMIANFRAALSLSLPPTTLGEIEALWQVRAEGCVALEVTWTDGTKIADRLVWYGQHMNDDGTPGSVTAKSGDAWKSNSIADGTLEFDGGGSVEDRYCALWTHEDQTNWPTAMRIRLWLLIDKSLPADARTLRYEVIVPVSQ